jgi:hypothetical protein
VPLTDDPLQQWISRLIEAGTGIQLPSRREDDPLPDFEARQVSWSVAAPHIAQFEDREGREDASLRLLRFGFFRLVDLSLIAYRQVWPMKGNYNDLSRGRLSPRREYRALHGGLDPRGQGTPHRSANRPSKLDVLTVLSVLAWDLKRETLQPHHDLLADLIHAVHPPLFIFKGKRGRPPSRLLTESLAQHRRTHERHNYDAEGAHERLLKEMEVRCKSLDL